MYLMYLLMIFLFGTFVGSFLNVVAYRFNTGRTLGGRSHCPHCAKTLGPHELIPVVSYCIQGGKCRNCKGSISPQYPIVELATGILFVLIFTKFQFFLFTFYQYFVLLAAFFGLIFTILLVIFIYDMRHQIIPNSLVYPFIALSFFAPFVLSNTMAVPYSWSLMTFISGPLVALPLFLLWAVSKGRWLGFGDVKLATGMGYLLGVSSGYAALMLSFWIGGILGVVLLLIGKHGPKGMRYTKETALPFAPFLIVGCAIAFFCALDLIRLVSLFH